MRLSMLPLSFRFYADTGYKKRFDPEESNLYIKDFRLPSRSDISSLSGKNHICQHNIFIYMDLSISIVNLSASAILMDNYK